MGILVLLPSQVCGFSCLPSPLTRSILCPSLLCSPAGSEAGLRTASSQGFFTLGICCIWPMGGSKRSGHGKREKFEYFFLLFPCQAVVLTVAVFLYPRPDLLLGYPSQHSPNPLLKSIHDNSFPLLVPGASPSLMNQFLSSSCQHFKYNTFL